MVDSSVLKECISKTQDCDLSVAFRLHEKVLLVKGEERQRVKFAGKLLSGTVAKVLQFFWGGKPAGLYKLKYNCPGYIIIKAD